ncbi:penicillin-binding protein 1A [Constrictibacter sp. MBR-5]|jgi:penicillin-binding protein 1A|uniref:transglycosylase domain-containing protein n=1 Tax=Constrictibacter sp. MBR-5 TaxID=3156467 RepID=UPI003395EFB4
MGSAGAKRGKRPAKGGGRRRGWGPLLRIGLIVGAWGMVLLIAGLAWLAWDLPGIETAGTADRKPSMTLLSKDDSYLVGLGELYGAAVDVDALPAFVPQALVAVEDRRFYDHGGLDPRGFARAIYVNVTAGAFVQGGSTITQQLAKNLFLTPERTLTRKLREALLALWLERKYDKDDILELYLNRVYLGAGAYGIDAAARRYFGKPAAEIGLWEAAVLAGLPKAPSRLAPTRNPDLAAERARLVLSLMVDEGYITQKQADAARRDTVTVVTPPGDGDEGLRYFADMVTDEVQAHLGFIDRDLLVKTTLDPAMQQAAFDALRKGLTRKPGQPEQGAIVAMTPGGSVRALVGGRDYAESQFNRATQALRQPGSAFKLFVFLAAAEAGIHPDDRYTDGPISIGDWSPGNYGDRYYGDVTVREAAARSLNSVAVQLADRVGPAKVIEAAERLGVGSDLRRDLSIALGTSEVTLMELTGAYATMANKGLAVWPHAVREITDRQGNILYRRAGDGEVRVVDADAVASVNDMLAAAVEWGTGKAARLDRPAAGKTGTTQDSRDALFVGFTAQLVAGVWTGNDDNSPMRGVTGGGVPARIWHDFMLAANKGLPKQPIPGVGQVPPRPAPSQPVAAAEPQRQDKGWAPSFLPKSWFGGGSSSSSSKAHSDKWKRDNFEKVGQ